MFSGSDYIPAIRDRAAPCAALGGSSDSACRHSECPVELACASLGCASSCIMNALQSTADAHVGQDAVQEHRSLVEMVIGLLPNRLVFPPVIERQYRDARAKSWWRRDVLGYLLFLLVISPLYVISTCYLDSPAAAAGSCNKSATMHQHNAGPQSNARNAPSAAAYHKLQLYPSYTTHSAAAATANNVTSSAAAKAPIIATAAAAPPTTSTSANSSSKSAMRIASMLLRPKQVALLYSWRLRSYADVALLLKVAAAAGALLLAVGTPGLYCKHQVRTAVVAMYLTAPLLLLPMQLLVGGSSSSNSAHSAAAASDSWHNASRMQGYVVLLSYAPIVVLSSSIMHPLPLMWQAGVNCLSWGSLTVAALILRMKLASSAATAAAVSSSNAQAAAAAEAMHAEELTFKLAFGALDGLLLSVLLPLLFRAWSSRRARRQFLLSGSVTVGSDALGQRQQQQQQDEQQQQPDCHSDRTAKCSDATESSNNDQAKKLITSDCQSIAAVKHSAAKTAAQPNNASDTADNAAADAGQFYIVRRISLPKGAAAAAGSSAAVNLDQPPTPTMALESRFGSSSSRSADTSLTPSDQSDSSVAAVVPRHDTADDSTGSRSETGSSSGASSSATEAPAAAAAAAGLPAQQQQQRGGALPASGAQTRLHRRYPQRPSALYTSPLETVVVSFKLAADSATPAAAAAVAPVQSAGIAGPSTATMHGRTAAAAGSGAGAGSQQLRAEIEAAVRQVVAGSDYQVLCTSVSTFPGCVHVVVNLQLCRDGDLAAQLAAAAAAAAGDNALLCAAQTGSSNNCIDEIKWESVVERLQQCKFMENAQSGHLTAAVDDNARDESSAFDAEQQQLQLQYMLVQDGAGTDQWYWEAPTAAAATAAAGASTGLAAAPAATADAHGAFRDNSSSSRIGSEEVLGSLSRAELAESSSSHGVIPDDSARKITHQPPTSDNSSESLHRRIHDESSDSEGSRDSLDSLAAIPINPIDSSISCTTSRSAGSGLGMLTPWQQQLLLQQHGSDHDTLTPSFDTRCSLSIPFTVQEDTDQTAAAAAAAVVHVAAAVRGNAQGIVMTEFALPSDQAWQEALSGPSLIVPDNLAASLAAAAAGLRVVVTAAAPAARECNRDSLVDVTLWPPNNSSSSENARRGNASANNASSNAAWPEDHSISLQQLLLANTNTPRLADEYGPVLAVNILATPAAAASGSSSSSSSSTMRECLLLQLPLLLVPSALCDGLRDLGYMMASDAESYEAAYYKHLLPLVRDITTLLLGPNSNPMQPLAAAAAAGATADSSNSPTASMHHQQQHTEPDSAVFLWLAQNVLRYLYSQGLTDAAAVLQTLIQESLPAAAAAATEVPAETDSGGSSEIEPEQGSAAAAAADSCALQHYAGGGALSNDCGAGNRSSLDDSARSSASASEENLADFLAKKQAAEAKAPAAAAEAKSDQFLVSEALKAAAAAAVEAQSARSTAAETSAALATALQSLSQLSATAAAAAQQAQRAESAAAVAARRAAAAEARSDRQRALYLIGGGHVEGGVLGQGAWGLLGAASGRRNAAAEVLSSPPVLPESVTTRDVLFGFSDERLEIQYRRLKALQIRFVDKAAFMLHVLREATIVWKIARALHAVSDTRLSLVLLCKYEAVTLLPYLMSFTCPDFWIQHRNFMLMLSQIACALTVGMITATEIYRQEWAQLLHPKNTLDNMIAAGSEPGTSDIRSDVQEDLTLISRPGMLIVWFYLLVPLLQQLCVPDQLVSCLAQAVQSYLVYRFIFRGGMGLWWLMGWLGLGAVVSLELVYLSDLFMRRQAVAAARRSLMQQAA